MSKSSIEWCTHTMNDQAGCTKISEACTNCYATTMSVRQSNMRKHVPSDRYHGVTNGDLRNPAWNGKIRTDLEVRHKNFEEIRNARFPRETFYNSMTDTFHESLCIEGDALRVLAEEVELLREGCKADQVVMFLTKRPGRLLAWQQRYFPEGLPPQVWVGSTVESQKRAEERLPLLSQVQAEVRFLSCEPLTGFIDFRPWADNIEWVIAGGESGRKARPADPDWFRSLRDQSFARQIPFHFKQWGEWDATQTRVGKKKAGRHLDGRTWDAHPGELVDDLSNPGCGRFI